jgi:DNA-binding Lrp family transcriptional regulator
MKKLEKDGIITGYFMMLDYSKFNLSTFKLLVQVSNIMDEELFEKYLSSIKSVKHFSKMLGPWDYEVDMLYSSMLELQQQIELTKQAFPHQIKKIEIISHGKRILTNQEKFLC